MGQGSPCPKTNVLHTDTHVCVLFRKGLHRSKQNGWSVLHIFRSFRKDVALQTFLFAYFRAPFAVQFMSPPELPLRGTMLASQKCPVSKLHQDLSTRRSSVWKLPTGSFDGCTRSCRCQNINRKHWRIQGAHSPIYLAKFWASVTKSFVPGKFESTAPLFLGAHMGLDPVLTGLASPILDPPDFNSINQL